MSEPAASNVSHFVKFGLDPIFAAAWLYYQDGLTQGEVAGALGVSRATVVNYLQEARTRGMVQIALAPERAEPVGLADDLCRRYGLESALVIPSHGSGDPSERIGAAGARILQSAVVRPGMTLGVAWGRTVLSLSSALGNSSIAGLSVVQIAGSMMTTYDFSPELCTSTIAQRLGGRCVNLHAPGLTSRADVRDVLMNEPSVARQFDLIRSSDAVVFGVGSLESSIVSMVFGESAQASDAVPSGAVAVLNGRFLDVAGRPVGGELDGRMVGLTLPEILAVPIRLCVAGGPGKIEALRAALVGGYPTIFVTDATTARAVLAEDS